MPRTGRKSRVRQLRKGGEREKEWVMVGPGWLYDFQRVGAAGPGTAAKGCRSEEKDGVGWDATGCGGM